MKIALKLILALIATAVVLNGCKEQTQPEQTQPQTTEQQQAGNAAAPQFTLTDHNGKQHSLSDYKGKTVLLLWINPDCPFVKRHYEKGTFNIASDYMSKGVVWLAINSTHYFDTEKNLKFATEEDVKYPILDDRDGTVGRLYDAKTTPCIFIIDKNGQIAYQGAVDDDPKGDKTEVVNYITQALDQILAGGQVTTAQTQPYGCTVKYAK